MRSFHSLLRHGIIAWPRGARYLDPSYPDHGLVLVPPVRIGTVACCPPVGACGVSICESEQELLIPPCHH